MPSNRERESTEEHGPPTRARRLAILTGIARIATRDLELRPMLQRITDALASRLGWELVALVRLEEGAPARFVCEALTTELPTRVHVGYSRELGSGVVGQVAATGKPVLLDDVSTFPGFVDTLPGARSEICVPVKHRGRVVAILNAESRRPGAFRGQLALARGVAAQVAGAIASAALYEDVKVRASSFEVLSEVSRIALEAGELETVLTRVVDFVHERFPLALVAIVVADEEGTEWQYRAFAPRRAGRGRWARRSWPIASGIVGRAIRTGEPQLVLDVARDPDYIEVLGGIGAELAVPIRSQRSVLGAINYEATDGAVFSAGNLSLFRALADQVAGAIQLSLVNRRLVESQEEIEEANRRLQAANRALEEQSRLDGVTGLSNRRHFDELLASEWRRAARSQQPLALVLADVDCFKAYNDSYGHQQGDACLRQVSIVLESGLQRVSDLAARYGGEEFALLLPGLDEATAAELAETLRSRLETLAIPHQASTVVPRVTLSAGVAAMVPGARSDPAVLVEAADRALYRAKQGGRNRVRRGG